MEIDKIETLIDKYFEGVTSIAEAQQLHTYFSSGQVAEQVMHYQKFFISMHESKIKQYNGIVSFYKQKTAVSWLSITVVVLFVVGVGGYTFYKSNSAPAPSKYGTDKDPQLAFEATQKALSILSNNRNVGIESVQYIEEHQIAKDKVFKKAVKTQGI